MNEQKAYSAIKTVKPMFVPCTTVFISSFCIMVLELVAGRLIARFLGSSLYTWTSVIGVVLAGITIGNYIGGRLADRFKPAKTLATLFAVCAATCLVTIIVNNLIGDFTWLWHFKWPTRILLHVMLVFLLPSTLLGTISPVVAKMALERGLPTGRTVGDIYAWGAAGSIVGTFMTGYYLIALMGTIPIIWSIAALMIVMAFFYGARLWTIRAMALIFLIVVLLGAGPWDWTRDVSFIIGLKAKGGQPLIYEEETNYSYIAVASIGFNPEQRMFIQDRLVHSQIIVGEPNNLLYTYEQIMVAITHRFAIDKPAFLIMGGGGYTLPRYLERLWPKGIVDVAEIDPGVTKAAFTAFWLDPKTKINTIQMDARNYIDSLMEQRFSGKKIKQYDFIYEDAINDCSVPYQLTTKEFNDKLYELMTDNGIYMIDLIDAFDNALFLGSIVNTLEKTFPFVTVISKNEGKIAPYFTFVAVAAKHEPDLNDVCRRFDTGQSFWYLNKLEIDYLRGKANAIVLTDDYAPVENLLSPVALRQDERQNRIIPEYALPGNLQKAMQELEQLIQTDVVAAAREYSILAFNLAKTGKTSKAYKVFETALSRFIALKHKDALPSIRYNYAVLLKNTGKLRQAAEQLDTAEQISRELIAENPQSIENYRVLGDILIAKHEFSKASECFRKILEMQPDEPENHLKLIQVLKAGADPNSAAQTARNAIEYFEVNNRKQEADIFRKYLDSM